MGKASEAVQLLDTAIKKELDQFKGIEPRKSFIENTDESSVDELLKKFESKDEDEKWDGMYHDPQQDQCKLADQAAAVSFMEAQHRELNRHYKEENEVSIYKHQQIGAASFLTVKDMIKENVTGQG